MKKIILDTDLGSDCDDAGALALLHRLADDRKAEIMAVTHCGTDISGGIAIKAINTYFGRADIPVGNFKRYPFLEESHCKRCSRPLMEAYLERNPMSNIGDATALMRKILSENKDVILIGIGMSNNFAELLRSTGDEISELSGMELVRQSVKELHIMGGNFEDSSFAEYNIKCDTVNAKFIAKYFPRPIIYCGFEIGKTIRTGSNLGKRANSPIRKAYKIKSKDGLRESWDPVTVYAAIQEEQEYLKQSVGVNIIFDDEGRTIINQNGKDKYWIMVSEPEELRKEIDRCMYD